MAKPLRTEIADAVADADGVDPADLDYALQEYVDLDAIEVLAAHGGSWTLTFELPDHEVTVTSDGLVIVDGVERRIDVPN